MSVMTPHWKFLLAVGALGLTYALLGQQAHGDDKPFGADQCTSIEDLKEARVAKDSRRVAVMTSKGELIEIWATPDGEKFTVFVHAPKGQICHLFSGENLRVTFAPGKAI